MANLNELIVGYLTVNKIAFTGNEWATGQVGTSPETITYWDTAKLGPQPSQAQLDSAYATYLDQQKALANKDKAKQLLADTDWIDIASVSDSGESPHLVNKADFTTYRRALRVIAVTPTSSAVFPTKPEAVWA